ncbi:MAG: sirohydrochlorin chelatase [Candidatus Hodarchaeales archaeon]|jgi:sirohydrochlorin cobaltochelatase
MTSTKEKKNNIVIVIAAHGSPAKDFPESELSEYFRLDAKFHSMPGGNIDISLKQRWESLDKKVREWPRTNDPYHASTIEIAEKLKYLTGLKVLVGFNEFCYPSIEKVLEEAMNLSPEKVIVITPMLTPGGKHAGEDIPATIDRMKIQHPNVPIVYAWPFDLVEVARFLKDQIDLYN